MARTRWRKPPPVPLSSPTSTVLISCYASQGKGEYRCPCESNIQFVLINAEGVVRVVAGFTTMSWTFHTKEVAYGDGWRILGWRMGDGTLPHGEHDRVDPAMCVFERLQEPNRPFVEDGAALYRPFRAGADVSREG